MLRTLTYFWRIHLAVILGAAVATAVLAGALLVGDSVRGSLRQLTLDRLGGVDAALVTDRLFRETLGDDLASHPGSASLISAVAPAIVLRGAAVNPASGSRASKVGIHGVDRRFTSLFGEGADLDFTRTPGQIFPSVIINESLRSQLDAEVGDALLLSFGRWSAVPRDTLMGEKDPDDVLASVRLSIARVLPDEGIARFGLAPNQQNPLNAFVSLQQMQQSLDARGRVNGLFVSQRSEAADADGLLEQVVGLEELGLRVRPGREHFSVESGEFVLRPDVDAAVAETIAELGAPMQRVQSYLANSIGSGERSVPYSLIAAVDGLDAGDWAALRLVDGRPAPRLSAQGILLNSWAAQDLGVRVGDPIDVTYFAVGPREELTVESAAFRLEGIVAMQGLADDSTLTPDYPGIQDAEDMSSWDPPFPVELGLIRPRDEEYWDRHRGTPKAFVAEETGRRLWSTRFGSTTSVRVGAAPGQSLQATRERFTADLAGRLSLDSFGLRFRQVKQEGLRAASGATDFSGLFIAFSVFLIVSSALLVGLLFSLGVEQRAREIGLRLALGFPLRAVRRALLLEGGLLAGLGALVGLGGAVGYAWLMMAGLRTVWLPAVGSSRLFLHVKPLSLALGWVIAVAVILFSIIAALRRLKRIPPPALLAGSFRPPDKRRRRHLATVVAWISAALALALVAYAALSGELASPGLTFGAGALLLVAGLAAFAAWCRRKRSGLGLIGSAAALVGMAARNSSWSPGRSILSVALVASACFVIVTVAANREGGGQRLEARDSGSGGFSLIAETDIPLHQNLARTEDRFDLGFSRKDQEPFAGAEILPFRLLPGDDASCLNLYQPEKPRVLGVPSELIERGGFRFQAHADLPQGSDNPWELLRQPIEPGVIPAIGDVNSVMWILHLGLGQDLVMDDELGRPLRLRLVGLLSKSVFQSELLISEEAFLEHFPGRTGYSLFLLDPPPETAHALTQVLESTLQPFGFDALTTEQKLADFLVVEHTYLSTFQMLGGLGLLLGTVGLGIILVRNVLERRAELATLRAFGFRRSTLAWMVLAENAFLLVVGIGVGTGAALCAVAPRLATIHVPWLSLLATLLVVLLVGMLSSVAAVSGALRVPLLPALKAD